MDKKELKETDAWTLYNQSVDYCRMIGMYEDTDLNYRMFNGDQWYGLKIKGVEKIQLNFIHPSVMYQTGVVMTNQYAVRFSSENFENRGFRKNAAQICGLLNKKAASIWEKDYMDVKLRQVVKDAAINDEGIIFARVDEETGLPTNEILNKTDIYYGNENDSDIQSQPYILIKQRMPVIEAQSLAEKNGVSAENVLHILGDNDNIEEAGESAKYEKDNMCTVVTKLYKDKGVVYFSQSTRYVDIKKDTRTGLKFYPVAHLLWEEKKGSSRGEGLVRSMIPNQIEVNKTAMRRALTVKNVAYPTRIANVGKIENPNEIDKVGAIIKTRDMTVDDVAKIFSFTNSAQMSTDVEKLQNDLVEKTRELIGAGQVATGQINPEQASGKAILAVKQANDQPLTEHIIYVKGFVEDLARIWLDIITVYNDSIKMEQETVDPLTGKKGIVLVEVLQDTLKELQATVKVDVTPKSSYDKFAQEMSLENLLTAGMFSTARMPELKLYVKALDDDSVMPKDKLEIVIEEWEKEQQKIANINAKTQLAHQRAEQFLSQDPEGQASQIAEAQMMLQQHMPGKARVIAKGQAQPMPQE